MRSEQAEVVELFAGRLLHRQCVRRRGGLEADGEEHHFALGMAGGDAQRGQWRIDHAHVGAVRFGMKQVRARAGHAEHVAV